MPSPQPTTFRFVSGLGGFAQPLASGFTKLAAAEAHALEWFAEHGYQLVYRERDVENNAIDFMMSLRGELQQFACEPQPNTPAQSEAS